MCDCAAQLALLITAQTAIATGTGIIAAQEIQQTQQDQAFYDCVIAHNQRMDDLTANNTNVICKHWENQIEQEKCNQIRDNAMDIASGVLAGLYYDLQQKYIDKYTLILEKRNELNERIKECAIMEIDHYKEVVLANICKAIDKSMGFSRVTVDYDGICDFYNECCDSITDAAQQYLTTSRRKTCRRTKLDCAHVNGDIKGWVVCGAVSAADDNARFDENRIPRRLDLISSAVSSAHGASFRIPNFDYQMFGQASNIMNSLASIYSTVANSAGGAFGYFAGNFVNGVSGFLT